MSGENGIGVRRRRVDGEAKVRGATRYAADIPVAGLLHARPVLSHEAHARILEIDTAAAREIPGVVAVLTAADLPMAPGVPGRLGEPLAREEVVFAGQPVALVVAETEAAAADGAAAVFADYEPLPVALDLEAAMEPGAPLARPGETVDHDEDDGRYSANVVGRRRVGTGDAAAALASSDVVVSGSFRSSPMYQAYIEPQTATAWLEPGGELVVSTSTQGAFATREGVATALGLPHDRVRVRPAPLGGAFGGKVVIVEPLVAAAAVALERPVRLVMTRMEDFVATNPAPGQLTELEVGATRDGRLTALRGRVILDRGAHKEYNVDMLAAMLAGGPYRWDARELEALGVLTNRTSTGAYRAPTGPPVSFALETLLDELAVRLGLDPIELRLRNVLHEGDTGPDGKPCPVIGAEECLQRLREHPLWARRGDLPDDEGIGVAIAFWPGGLEPAAASCRLDSDGGVTVITGAVDMSGTETGFRTIAAAAFGVPEERVRVEAADTSGAGFSGLSGGSKIIYTVGRAVEQAALQAREQLLDIAAAELEIAPEDLEIAGGAVQPAGAPAQAIEIDDLARRVLTFGSTYAPVEGHGRIAQASRAPSAAAHLSHVRVDRETGGVTVLAHVVVQDVGRALNPSLVEGQMTGGVAQGLGWALHEGLAHDEEGQLQTGSMVDYTIPSFDLVPAIEADIVEVPAPDGPFGAKGVGEAPVVAVPPAVAAAIAAATGIRLRELPMSPERVWAALSDGAAG